MTSRRVAACVITGFLGSGKTTLLRGLLERDGGRDRIAVVVNEIGEIGIDGRVLSGFEFVENVVELASGCICCSIDEYRFDLAVDELIRRVDPALLVIETSGAADPAPTLERLRRCGIGIDSVVTVVDARAWQTAWRTSGAARRQIAAADFLVISKGDLVTARTLSRLRERLAGWNPRARILDGRGAEPFEGGDLLLATTAARPRAPKQRATDAAHLKEDGLESFSWRTDRNVDRASLEQELRRLPAEVLRAKGFVRGEGDRSAWLFQVVCGRVEMSVFEGGAAIAPGAQGVFIGAGIAALRESIVERLDSCASEPSAACNPPADSAMSAASRRMAG